MTDNNADETDGQGINLSRRGAVALLGTSAVGGTVATGAFSQLTADRPVDVEVVGSGGDSETSANNTSSSLRISNNVDERINTTISATNLGNVSLVGLNSTDVSMDGTTNANISSTSSSWELTDLRPGETVEVKYQQNTTSPSADVTFDVEAFSGTDGYSIGSDQAVSVASIPASGVSRWPLHNTHIDYNNNRVIDVWNDNDGTVDAGSLNPAGGPNGTGDALAFDDDVIEIASVPEFELSNFSVSMWVKPNVLPEEMSTGAPAPFGHRDDDTERFSIHATSNSEIRIWDGDRNNFTYSWDTTWTHLVITADGSSYEMFADGSSLGTSGDGTPKNNNPAPHIGSGGRTSFWEGRISDVRYYSKALSSTEVTSLYNNGHI